MSVESGKVTFILDPEIRFVGNPIDTEIFSSSGEQYHVWKLKTPVKVYSSMNLRAIPIELDELYLRASSLERDDWEGSVEEGLYIPGWIADFSENMCLGLYQEKTIREWFNNKSEIIERKKLIRGIRRNEHLQEINRSIREKIAQKGNL